MNGAPVVFEDSIYVTFSLSEGLVALAFAGDGQSFLLTIPAALKLEGALKVVLDNAKLPKIPDRNPTLPG